MVPPIDTDRVPGSAEDFFRMADMEWPYRMTRRPVRTRGAPPPLPGRDDDSDLDIQELMLRIDRGWRPIFVDLRPAMEVRRAYLPGSLLMPASQLPHRLAELTLDSPFLLICARGHHSRALAHFMRERGRIRTWSLSGGLSALSRRFRLSPEPSEAPLHLLTPVRFPADDPKASQLARKLRRPHPPRGWVGTVQEIRATEQPPAPWEVSVRFAIPGGGSHLVTGLVPSDLEPTGVFERV